MVFSIYTHTHTHNHNGNTSPNQSAATLDIKQTLETRIWMNDMKQQYESIFMYCFAVTNNYGPHYHLNTNQTPTIQATNQTRIQATSSQEVKQATGEKVTIIASSFIKLTQRSGVFLIT